MATKITRNLLRQYYGIGTTPTYHLCTPFTRMQESTLKLTVSRLLTM